LKTRALELGFLRARIYAPAPFGGSMLLVALAVQSSEEGAAPAGFAEIAGFARKNYYHEAVIRLKQLASEIRKTKGASKAEYRIFCNSFINPLGFINEKTLAADCGLGLIGKNNLLFTPEAGSNVVLAALALPFELKGDAPLSKQNFLSCAECAGRYCVQACPTGALAIDGTLKKERCLQWYLSGHENHVPEDIVKLWGRRLYGCMECQRWCPHNKKSISTIDSKIGSLPRFIDAAELLAQTDDEIKIRFKRTALGLSWLGPSALRRSAKISLQN
jgi:epoxyqueuosine reductase